MRQAQVIYYSHTGNTARVANAIAETLAVPIEEITESKPRGGWLTFVLSGFAAAFKKSAPINPVSQQAKDAEMIILGSPVWAQNMATPIRTYLRKHADKPKIQAVFCTVGGFGGEDAMRRITAEIGHDMDATLIITQEDFESGLWTEKVTRFADAIRAAGLIPAA